MLQVFRRFAAVFPLVVHEQRDFHLSDVSPAVLEAVGLSCESLRVLRNARLVC